MSNKNCLKNTMQFSELVDVFKAQDRKRANLSEEPKKEKRSEDNELCEYVEGLRQEICPEDDIKEVVGHERVLVTIVKAFHLNKFPNGGISCILLAGVPGCGKSTILASAASLVARSLHKNVSLWNLSVSNLLSKFHGSSESTIRILYESASRRSPSLILLDEVDTLMGERGQDDNGNKVKGELLARMQGAKRYSNVLTICATNLPESLDSGFKRRFQAQFSVDAPTDDQRIVLISKAFKNYGIVYENLGFSEDVVVKHTDGLTGDALERAVLSVVRYASNFQQKGNVLSDIEFLQSLKKKETSCATLVVKDISWEMFLKHGIKGIGHDVSFQILKSLDDWKASSRPDTSGFEANPVAHRQENHDDICINLCCCCLASCKMI